MNDPYDELFKAKRAIREQADAATAEANNLRVKADMLDGKARGLLAALALLNDIELPE